MLDRERSRQHYRYCRALEAYARLYYGNSQECDLANVTSQVLAVTSVGNYFGDGFYDIRQQMVEEHGPRSGLLAYVDDDIRAETGSRGAKCWVDVTREKKYPTYLACVAEFQAVNRKHHPLRPLQVAILQPGFVWWW